jgi:hypothetical protein
MTTITPNTFISRTKINDFTNPKIQFVDYTKIVTTEKTKEFASTKALFKFFADSPHYKFVSSTTEDTQFRGKVFIATYTVSSPTLTEMSEKQAYAKAKENLKALTKAYQDHF